MKEHTNQLDLRGLKHGVFKTYWSNDTIWWELRYRHGQIHGLWKSYWSEGTLWEKSYYLVIK